MFITLNKLENADVITAKKINAVALIGKFFKDKKRAIAEAQNLKKLHERPFVILQNKDVKRPKG